MASFKENILMIFGYKYILNINSGEVHSLKDKKSYCGVKWMAKKNKEYLTTEEFGEMYGIIYNGKLINGCRFCCPKRDLG